MWFKSFEHTDNTDRRTHIVIIVHTCESCNNVLTGFTESVYMKLFACETAGVRIRTLNWMLGSRVYKPYGMRKGCCVHNKFILDAQQPCI